MAAKSSPSAHTPAAANPLANALKDFTRRNALIAQFRRKVYAANNIVWFPHQAEWQLATEGYTLVDMEPQPGQLATVVRIPDEDDPLGQRYRDEPRLLMPRVGGHARFASDLAAFKAGKSFGGALWLTGFAIVPYEVHIIGFQYSTSEPEFNYLCEFLLSERGMNMKAAKLLNDRRQGRMMLWLTTGAKFEVKTWEQKEALKGKRVLAYYYAEAYQLPGLEVFTSIKQNLRELQGFAAFTTTPDRPWVGALHDLGHGADYDWHCSCGVTSRANPFTFSKRDWDREDPDQNGLMTRERFAISNLGQLGRFIGRVYNYGRGQKLLTPSTHPYLWNPVTIRETIPKPEDAWP